jgi:Tfp pilus assembly protein PilO
MTDEKATDSDRVHAGRVRGAFDSFSDRLHGKLDDETRESVEKLRQAASEKDADTLRRHLTEVRDRHSWLYRELVEHPEIASLLDELALLGL